MQKYKSIYSLILFTLLSLNSLAQDTAPPSYMLNFGLAGSPGDFIFKDLDGNAPNFSNIIIGFNKKVDERMYFGLNTGRLSASYENKADSNFYRIDHFPIGLTFGIWSRKSGDENLGLEFSSGLAFPTQSELQVRSATYFSVKGLLFINKDKNKHTAISIGYMAINNTLMDFTYARRDIMTIGFSIYAY